jgi:hypothetical protein
MFGYRSSGESIGFPSTRVADFTPASNAVKGVSACQKESLSINDRKVARTSRLREGCGARVAQKYFLSGTFVGCKNCSPLDAPDVFIQTTRQIAAFLPKLSAGYACSAAENRT